MAAHMGTWGGTSHLLPDPVEFNACWESQAAVCSALSKDKQASQKLCIAVAQDTASLSFLHQYPEATGW